MPVKETLQAELEKCAKRKKLSITRLRTPNYGYRGVRYPADFVLWLENATILLECKQRKKLPLTPSDIRQMPFMQAWEELDYVPAARYMILVKTDTEYAVFTSSQAVKAAETHKGLRKEDAVLCRENIAGIVFGLCEVKWQDAWTE